MMKIKTLDLSLWIIAFIVLSLYKTSYASVDEVVEPHTVNQIAKPAPESPFAVPESLIDYAAFWRNVYSYWRLDQIVFHDTDIPGLIYDVITLEGEVDELLSSKQRDQIDRHREALELRLNHIEANRKNAEALNNADRALMERIVALGGERALVDTMRHVRAQRGLRGRFHKGLEISGKYIDQFRAIFREAGLPEDLAYIPHVESSFQNHARSSVGATGMWQFTRSAGRIFSLKINKAVDQRLDPVASARGAARYFRQAYETLGNWPMAVTSYNHGIAGMARAKSQFGEDFGRIVREYKSRTFGFASRNFYAEFLAARDIALNHEFYFPEGVDYEAPINMDTIVLDRPTRPRDIADAYGVAHKELVSMNTAWTPRAVKANVALPAGTEVWLPSGLLEARRGDEGKDNAKAAETGRAANAIAGSSTEPVQQGKSEAGSASDNTGMITHVVRKGDNPTLIAANYGVSLSDLLHSNKLTRKSVIRPGMKLGIPINR